MVESFENRDLKCAGEVAEMARLGKFDTEFLIFGSAVQEADGRIYYYATTKQDKLYGYMQQACQDERYFMPMVQYMRRLKVPVDLQEEWTAKSKLELIKRMKQQYEHFLPCLQPFCGIAPNNNAELLLTDYQESIDGYFDADKLQLFWGVVLLSFEKKILTRDAYKHFKTWHNQVQQQMSDDPIDVGNITRVFYGFIYLDEQGLRQTVFDAQAVDVAEKWREKLMQGYIVAPIVKKQYALKEFSEMPKVRQAYRQWLLAVESIDYLALVRRLYDMAGVIDGDTLQAVVDAAKGQEYAEGAARYYQALWNKC